jgi:peptide chain release factor 1
LNAARLKKKLLEKLREVEAKYERLAAQLSDPNVVGDRERFQSLAKQHADLTPLYEKLRNCREVERQLDDTRGLIHESQGEMRHLAEEELRDLEERSAHLQQELRLMLLPKDPNDERDTIVEIRAGTGGDEAALFAGDLLRMYTRYAEQQGWKSEILSSTPSGTHGFREVVLSIKGRGAYSHFKFEGGPHRVQRVPETESSGRLHTSAATVAVLPEVEEVEVQIHRDDLKIDTYRSAGAGGQNVQKNETAIRITHKPTGIVVSCQDERSLLQNREKAMRMLRARLFDRMQAEQDRQQADARRSQVASGDRSDKIRTYNFPQNRVTDHRIGLTLYNLGAFMEGDIGEMVQSLRTHDESERLAREGEVVAG